jgi:hypothetical protein
MNMTAKALKSREDWKEVTEATDEHLKALEDFQNKKPGYHPHQLAYAVQKTRDIRNTMVGELRHAFTIIQGGKK